MKLIVCLDDNNGMMFNKRRQSRDRVLVENILEFCKGEKVYTSEYSVKLFPENTVEIFENIEQIGISFCFAEDFTVNEKKKTFIFDKIDFSSKEITLNYKGIDFPRKNYILCNDIRYKSDSYHNYCTNDPIFRDEKSLGFSIPIKEKYDVAIDRGSSRAFEKHLQLSEIKTWNDLEKYNNGNLLKI